MKVLLVLFLLLFSNQALSLDKSTDEKLADKDVISSQFKQQAPPDRIVGALHSTTVSAVDCSLECSAKETPEYFKILSENTATIGLHINYLLLFVSVAMVIATILGFSVVKRNKTLHDAFMDLQEEIKDKVKYSVDIAVAQEMSARSSEYYEYSKSKLDELQGHLSQAILTIEQITENTKKIVGSEVVDLTLNELKEVKHTLFGLLSIKEAEVDNALIILKGKINNKEWIFFSEQMIYFIDDIVLNNSICKISMSFRDRLEEIKETLRKEVF